ncbi:hypothetical protein [Paenibacillus sp.]|uniref:hypothetical protein n=1 Tax=Paenibacillus sp. TaxID=58172 RepID=UPI002811E965|nr:hypothetical protein [Paenibacillus sp.]
MGWWRRIGKTLGFGAGAKALEPYPRGELADGCGLRLTTEALLALERRVASAFGATFLEHVRGRVMAAHPTWTDDGYDWALLELRRFFFMSALRKDETPMYSSDADAIWHEMLLFTREYETLCAGIADRTIAHVPHVAPPSRAEAQRARVEFELLYGTLFRLYPANERLLGAFGRHRFGGAEVEALGRMDADRIAARWFADGSAAGLDAARALERSVQAGLEEARRRGPSTNDPRLASDYAAGLIVVSVLNSSASGADDAGGAGDAGDGSGSGGDGGGASCGGGCGSG